MPQIDSQTCSGDLAFYQLWGTQDNSQGLHCMADTLIATVDTNRKSLYRENKIPLCFQGKPFNIIVIHIYAPITNAEKAEVEQFYEDLQDLLELTPKRDVPFIIGDCNANVGSQEIPGVTGMFGLGVQSEAGHS